MADREKVIRGLECCLEDEARDLKCWEDGDYPECPYNDHVDGCMGRLNRDALALLKAQEPVEPIVVNGSRYIYCGNCKRPLCDTSDDYFPTYCEYCGRAVKWE